MGDLTLIFWNVEHGSATYVETPNGTRFVYDLGTGKNGKAFSPLENLHKRHGVHKIDELVITHPDKDHIEDILNIDKFDIGSILYPHKLGPRVIEKAQKAHYENARRIFEKFFEYTESKGRNPSWDIHPRNPFNNGGVVFEEFYPRPEYKTNRENNHSIVTIINYMGHKIMIPGDNEEYSWNYLLEKKGFRNAIQDVEVLLAPHHGRKVGFHDELMRLLQPSLKICVISDGEYKDTSNTKAYGKYCQGYKVDMGFNVGQRKCLTTRSDGYITLRINETGKMSVRTGNKEERKWMRK